MRSAIVALVVSVGGALLAADATPPKAQQTITVTATRTESRLSDTPASVVVLSMQDVAKSASATLDGTLRQVPGFTLFRRSGSEVANPTSQGVSLRAIGANGASRALVLDDGIPLNDPFGGWIYWGRVPRAALERVEVLRGGASDLYGSAAMGGVVQFIRRTPSRLSVDFESSAGSSRTGAVSLFAAAGEGEWHGSVAGDLYSTAGWVLVDPALRGTVDTRATSRHDAIDATLERSIGDSGRSFLRFSHYGEGRDNGTPLQVNDTRIAHVAAGFDDSVAGGMLDVRLFGSDQSYAQTFSAIAGDRNSERLTVDQHVPARSRGASLQWSRPVAAKHAILGGLETRDVEGESDELRFGTRGTTPFRAGGHQRTASLFVEDVFAAADRLSITAGLRYDIWRNFDAFRNADALATRNDSASSPRLSALFRLSDGVALTASAYRAFRAPTLNELYRGFRVGNVVTNANDSLGPERLSALELGVRFAHVRVNAFEMRVDDPVANVTLSITPSLITRERQNLGQTRTRGLEVESDWSVGRWRASAGWLLADAGVTRGDLEGNRLPQVPRSQATVQASADIGRSTLAVQTRWSTMQFDDDLNQLPLRPYDVTDLSLNFALQTGTALLLVAENLFDRRVEVAATPVTTLGPPRSLRLGFRYAH